MFKIYFLFVPLQTQKQATKRNGIHLWHNHENEDTEVSEVNILHIS